MLGGVSNEYNYQQLKKELAMSKFVFLFVFLFIILSSLSFAQGRWESATNIGKERTGDLMLTRCIYKTLGGYQFSIVVRSLVCPFSIQVNPETGQYR